MLDILAIKADVYHLERQGKRLPVYRYLREVWQKEPPSEGLTVLALQQMRYRALSTTPAMWNMWMT